MPTFEYYRNMDQHPEVGTHETLFKAKLSEKPHLDNYFNGHPDYNQVQNCTRGKTYEIYRVDTFGDCADFYFRNDLGDKTCLADKFFEPAEK